MAAPTAKSGTLTISTVASVAVSVDAFGPGNQVGVLNRSSTGVIWVRTDGVDPTVAGDNCFPVLSYRAFNVPAGGTEVTIKLISDAALAYTVEGVDSV